MRLRPVEWCTLATAVTFVAAVGLDAMFRRPPVRGVWLLLGLGLSGLVLLGIGLALNGWQRDRWRALLPLALALGGFAVSFPAADAGTSYRDRQFRRALPAYELVVDRFRSGALPPGVLSLDSLPADLRGCCYRVVGLRDATGHWVVEFWVARRFPVHHEAWMYYAGASLEAVARERAWYRGYRVAPQWYSVTD
jgi:hypothetical protein